MPRRIAIAATCLIAALTIVARAQPQQTANDSRLDAALQRLVSEDGVPGVAVAIVDEGRVVYANGFGVTSLAEPTRPVTRDTVFHLASVTKTFVATAVIQLVERRQLSLDAPIVTH